MLPPAVRFSPMQRSLYRALVLVLFQLVGFIAHAAVEIPVALLLAQDFYRFGITYERWRTLHMIFTVTLQVAALVVGLLVGARWWRWLTRADVNVPPYLPPIRYL